MPNQLLFGSYSARLHTQLSGKKFCFHFVTSTNLIFNFIHVQRIFLFGDFNARKYATAEKLEENLNTAVENFVKEVAKHEDGVIDVPTEIMKLIGSFIAAMCYGNK